VCSPLEQQTLETAAARETGKHCLEAAHITSALLRLLVIALRLLLVVTSWRILLGRILLVLLLRVHSLVLVVSALLRWRRTLGIVTSLGWSLLVSRVLEALVRGLRSLRAARASIGRGSIGLI